MIIDRRDERLDRYLNQLVDITFWNGEQKTGVLEWGMQPKLDKPPRRQYSVYVFGTGVVYFYKTNVRKVRVHICD